MLAGQSDPTNFIRRLRLASCLSQCRIVPKPADVSFGRASRRAIWWPTGAQGARPGRLEACSERWAKFRSARRALAAGRQQIMRVDYTSRLPFAVRPRWRRPPTDVLAKLAPDVPECSPGHLLLCVSSDWGTRLEVVARAGLAAKVLPAGMTPRPTGERLLAGARSSGGESRPRIWLAPSRVDRIAAALSGRRMRSRGAGSEPLRPLCSRSGRPIDSKGKQWVSCWLAGKCLVGSSLAAQVTTDSDHFRLGPLSLGSGRSLHLLIAHLYFPPSTRAVARVDGPAAALGSA